MASLSLLLIGSAASAQQYVISTIAGGAPPPTPIPGFNASIGALSGVATDAAGNIYFSSNNSIFKLDLNGTLTRVAGNSRQGYSGDGGPAINAQIGDTFGLATDNAGNTYIADSGNNRVRKVSSAGVITTIAGTGVFGYSGDNGPAIKAQLNFPTGLALDNAGNLYIADSENSRIRKVSVSGIITTVAGNGTPGFSSDGGLAIDAQLGFPSDIILDKAGNIYLTDAATFGAGNGDYSEPIRKITPNGKIATVAFNSPCLPTYNLTPTRWYNPCAFSLVAGYTHIGITVDALDNVYATGFNTILKIAPNGLVTTIAGFGSSFDYSGDGGPAIDAYLSSSSGLGVDAAGNIYIADMGHDAIRMLQPLPSSPAITAITSAASNLPGTIAPGEIVIIYGSGMGPAQLTQSQADDSGRIGTKLAGTEVMFDGISAPILYTWATQAAVIVPYELWFGFGSVAALMQVSYGEQTLNPVTIQGTSSIPGIFTVDSSGNGQAAAINENKSVNDSTHPAPVGTVVSFYATGEGQTSSGAVDGQIAGFSPPKPILPVSVSIGGIPATVEYAGGAPGSVAGVMQVNARIPAGVQPGPTVSLILTVGDASTQTAVTIAVAAQ